MVPKFKLSNDLKFDANFTSASTAVGGPSVGWLAGSKGHPRPQKAVVPPAQAFPSGRAGLRRLDVNISSWTCPYPPSKPDAANSPPF